MEIRARYFLIGVFVLAAAGAIVGFVFWLNNTGGLVERMDYRVRFGGPVLGLSAGSEVLFNGIKVGEVTRLALNTDNPGEVMATVAIDRRTPIRSDTHVGIAYSGLTGTATVALSGGTPSAPPLQASDGEPPILVADSAALKDMTQAARDVLARLDAILAENAEPLKSAIANIDTFAGALARNSDKVDGILAGLQRLTGGGEPKVENVIYDLTAPDRFPPIDRLPSAQLVIAEPTALVVLDTQRILREQNGAEVPVFDQVRWSDSLPLLIESRLIQAFENAGQQQVGSVDDDLEADFRLLVDMRRFRIQTSPTPAATAELAARVVAADGRVLAGRAFSASEPLATAEDAALAAAALDAAFGRVATGVVVWTLEAMASAATSDPGAGAPANAKAPASP
ncbi:MAG: ABC-type transport auxiliary lipoprotein family protein [Bauldia sp.]